MWNALPARCARKGSRVVGATLRDPADPHDRSGQKIGNRSDRLKPPLNSCCTPTTKNQPCPGCLREAAHGSAIQYLPRTFGLYDVRTFRLLWTCDLRPGTPERDGSGADSQLPPMEKEAKEAQPASSGLFFPVADRKIALTKGAIEGLAKRLAVLKPALTVGTEEAPPGIASAPSKTDLVDPLDRVKVGSFGRYLPSHTPSSAVSLFPRGR